MKTLHATYFEPEDRRYDGGQYKYFIDRNFQPKQEPGSARFFFLRNNCFQITTIKNKPGDKAVDLGSFIRMNKTSDGVVKYFEGESLLSE